MAPRKKNITIEEGFEKLSDILDKMDEDGITLEASFKLYSEGVELVNDLNNRLNKTEERIYMINEEDSHGK